MKKIFSLLLILVAFISINVSAKTITKEQLQNGYNSFFEKIETNATASVTDDKVTITVPAEDDNDEFAGTFDYAYVIEDNKVIFTDLETINSGISYNAYKEKTDDASAIVAYNYSAVLEALGHEGKDGYAYAILQAFNTLEDFSWDMNNNYYILTGDITCNEDDQYCIEEDKFGEKAVEYTKFYSKESTTTDENNTYTLTTKTLNETSTSIDVSNVLTINLDSDFSKIDGSYDELVGTLDEMFSELESFTEVEESTQKSTTTENPQTGVNTYVMLIAVAIIALTSTIFFRKKVFRRL